MIKRWADHDGCAAAPTATDHRVDRTSRAHSATKYIYPNCRDGASVILWKLAGAGHVWPGGKQKVLERILGPSTDIIDANREMWEFFKRFAL
jgi:polyhydroxybutyrate depolymerase